MAKNLTLRSSYYESIKIKADEKIKAGNLVVTVGGINGFPLVTAVKNQFFIAVTRAEKVLATKAAGAITAGAAVYWVTASKHVATSGDVLIGFASEDAVSGAATVLINFDGALAFAKA